MPNEAVRIIQLTRGFTAIIDPEDAERVEAHSWQAHTDGSGLTRARRGVRNGKKVRTEMLSHFILGAESGAHIRHVNGNSLDYRKSNLRVNEPRLGYDAFADEYGNIVAMA
jgi:hypothetical protein